MTSNLNSSQRDEQRHYNKGGMLVFIASMIVTLGFFAVVCFIGKGIDLHEVKDPVAGSPDMKAAGAEAAPKKLDFSQIKEPWVSSPELVAEGEQVFKNTCAMCHGNEGKGDGPAGASLNPKPRNLVEGKWKKGGTSLGIFDVISNGIPGSSMAPWKGSVSVGDRWALVHFVRSITKNKVPDDDAKLKQTAPTLK